MFRHWGGNLLRAVTVIVAGFSVVVASLRIQPAAVCEGFRTPDEAESE